MGLEMYWNSRCAAASPRLKGSKSGSEKTRGPFREVTNTYNGRKTEHVANKRKPTISHFLINSIWIVRRTYQGLHAERTVHKTNRVTKEHCGREHKSSMHSEKQHWGCYHTYTDYGMLAVRCGLVDTNRSSEELTASIASVSLVRRYQRFGKI
jgi:hypothetical protein